ncbi:MAG: DUF177 domain-containing protein [Candidatus Krumholzibacteriia bacterium]
MILDLDKVSTGSERIEGREVVGFRDAAGDENRIDCHVELSVRRNGETYYIEINLTGTFSTACHRCLESTRFELNPSFGLVVQRSVARGEPEGPAADGDFIRLPAGQTELSLDPYIYENLIVNIPMQICCGEGCRGLCSGCGRNLNREECVCDGPADSRWDALRKLTDLEDSS